VDQRDHALGRVLAGHADREVVETVAVEVAVRERRAELIAGLGRPG
jgi:hypothetical protein